MLTNFDSPTFGKSLIATGYGDETIAPQWYDERTSIVNLKRWWRIILGLSAILVVLLLVGFYRGWSARNRPPLIVGAWHLDDLRTSATEDSIVNFSALGEFDGDSAFGTRWIYRDGRVYFRTWRLNDDSDISRILTNTTLYSWISETDEFSLKADFNEDGSVLTLTDEETGPRCLLRRVQP